MAIKSVLIDLSGTLHIENTVTPSAIAALQRLRKAALNIKFVTNTTKESRKCLYDRLVRLGFSLKEEEIFTSLRAARQLIDKNQWKKPLLLLEPAALEDFAGISEPQGEEPADAVVIGLSPKHFCYDTLNKAFRHILNNRATLVAIHKARYFKEPSGLSLGPGGFAQALEYATGSTAVIVGKPEPRFFMEALDGHNPKEAVMIGDDVQDDIGGAQACGIRGFLVKTGKYRDGDQNRITPPPFAVCENFAEAVENILSQIAQ